MHEKVEPQWAKAKQSRTLETFLFCTSKDEDSLESLTIGRNSKIGKLEERVGNQIQHTREVRITIDIIYSFE